MGFDQNEPEQRRRLRAAMKAADISLAALWLKYFGLSGDAGPGRPAEAERDNDGGSEPGTTTAGA